MRYRKQLIFTVALMLPTLCTTTQADSQVDTDAVAREIVDGMSTREKIGQKLMMAFRYWCDDDHPSCTSGMTTGNPDVMRIVRDNGLGGVIFFSDNIQSIDQAGHLVEAFGRANSAKNVGLLLAIDQEGGNVFRLPRDKATTFPGNMALAAAYLGSGDAGFAVRQGEVLATEMASLGLNVNFAPTVDVNSNPLNPVINVRSLGDDPGLVGLLGTGLLEGMANRNVIGVLKHFPGHGDTTTDSHFGLPVVDKSREDAFAIDLAPYRAAFSSTVRPDMVMTAHIQYGALDSSRVTTLTGESIVVPATMSRTIQRDILRDELGFDGVTVTDSLEMKAIADFFDPVDALIRVFRADVDIALMPVEVRRAADAGRLSSAIDAVVAAVDSGDLDREELDESVRRIVRMKMRRGIVPAYASRPVSDVSIIGSEAHREVERKIAAGSITMIRNDGDTLPIADRAANILIVTPWQEQATAMQRRFAEHGFARVTHTSLAAVTDAELRRAIDKADVVLLGSMTTRAGSPVTKLSGARGYQALFDAGHVMSHSGSLVFNEDQSGEANVGRARIPYASDTDAWMRLRSAMEYVSHAGRKLIHVTMRAPYDSVDFDDLPGATLATYSYFGYEGGLRGPSLPMVVDVVVGSLNPMGRLPVNVYEPATGGSAAVVRYPRGHGLRYPSAD
ncbi:beta-N-acetylhexosaminidase [Luteibacter rhizovicinus]|uniref:beta-N-acetylhexosaminidase n=1 Tax=Luteibacter rhizovicinus TaxID=242606 RepID=A0A4V2W483_9GAMM|nr:glycoside hydrolase family 3 protein [Luteibacter rhizovicinus]TCV94819.1 beta-N-acetylhexosaminidase [Luteibacter rhizovicinus]